jgi:hypothetical protein
MAMRVKLSVFLMTLGLLVMALPVLAHHSFAAEFDGNKPVTLTGTVTKVEWRNPHIWVYLDAKDADGKMTPWQCEGGAPNALTRQGWNRDTLKVGEPVVIDGYKAKDGSNTCNARAWKLPNGKTVFAGSADDGGPAGRGQQNR